MLFRSGRYWLLLNPDVVVPEGGIEALVAWMDTYLEPFWRGCRHL